MQNSFLVDASMFCLISLAEWLLALSCPQTFSVINNLLLLIICCDNPLPSVNLTEQIARDLYL